MFCKNCGNEVNEKDIVCPKCGKKITPDSFKRSTFSVKIPQKELENENLGNIPSKNDSIVETEKEETETQIEQNTVQQIIAVAEKSDEDSQQEEKLPPKTTKVEKTYKPESNGKKKNKTKNKSGKKNKNKKEKSAYIAIKLICCLCAVLIVALSVVNKTTNIFDFDNSSTKTIALSKLSEEDKLSFEKYFADLSVLYGKDIDFGQIGVYDFLDMLEPYNEGGLYAARFGKAKVETEKPDPAERFSNGEGTYSYCRIKADDVKSIADSLGVKLINSANNDRYYFSNDSYYFAAEEAKTKKSDATATVSNSKQTEDGLYYVECDVENGDCEKVYCLVDMDKEDGITSWVMNKISTEPLFNDDGTQIEPEVDESIPYKMKYTRFSAKTKDGVTYAKYEISYPVFSENTSSDEKNQTASTINMLYSDMIKAYKEKAADADASYEVYVRRGYVESLLPGTVNIVSTVKFNKEGYISLLDEINEYSPVEISKAAKQVVRDAEKIGVTKNIEEEVIIPDFAVTTYSGYTVNTETAEFVKKDEILGKDYQPYQDKLFKIYSGYDVDSDEVINDYEEIGRTIYSGAWVMTDKGVGFCYQNPNHYNEFIVLPEKYISTVE